MINKSLSDKELLYGRLNLERFLPDRIRVTSISETIITDSVRQAGQWIKANYGYCGTLSVIDHIHSKKLIFGILKVEKVNSDMNQFNTEPTLHPEYDNPSHISTEIPAREMDYTIQNTAS